MAEEEYLIKYNVDTSEVESSTPKVKQSLESVSASANTQAQSFKKVEESLIAAQSANKMYSAGTTQQKLITDKVIVQNVQYQRQLQKTTAAQSKSTQAMNQSVAAQKALQVAGVAAGRAMSLLSGFIGGALVSALDLLRPLMVKVADVMGFTTKKIEQQKTAYEKLEEAAEIRRENLEAEIELLKSLGKLQDANNTALQRANERLASAEKELQKFKGFRDAQIALINPNDPEAFKKVTEATALWANEITKLDTEVKLAKAEVNNAKKAIDEYGKETTKTTEEVKAEAGSLADLKQKLAEAQKQFEMTNASNPKFGQIAGDVVFYKEKVEELSKQLDELLGINQEIEKVEERIRIGRGADTSTGGRVRASSRRPQDLDSTRNAGAGDSAVGFDLGNAMSGLMALSEVSQMISNIRLQNINAEIDALNRLKDVELSNAELTARQREKIEERYQKRINQIKTQAAKAQRRADIAQAIINTAVAITSLLGRPIQIAIAAALGAAQIALIASQPLPKFKKGGLIKGASHERGGVALEAEGGEYIMSKKSVDKVGLPFLDAINEGHKTVRNPHIPREVLDNIVKHPAAFDMKEMAALFDRSLAKQPKVSINMDQNGFTKHIQEGVNKRIYANKKFRA